MMQILFVGNSYTFFNDLPDMLDALLKENGIAAQVKSVTKGGRRLYENLNPEDPAYEALCAIRTQGVDVLFLQEQSHFPLDNRAEFARGVQGLQAILTPARTILYATWGRKAGAPLLAERGWTSEQMGKGLTDAYASVAAASGATMSPVGDCFAECGKRYPDLELYAADGSHPSYLGSALALLAHYRALMGVLPQSTASIHCAQTEIDALRCVVEAVFSAL